MKVLIIYAHPSKKSFTYQILLNLEKGILTGGHELEISDLYAQDFQSDMSEEEYNREGFSKLEMPISKEVVLEQKKLDNADVVIFLYPVWWSDCPAKLKGWFDRVYTVGYAYGYDETASSSSKMTTKKNGIVICTAGHPNEFLEEIGIAESMRKVMIEDRLGKRFEQKEMVILGGTLDMEKVRQRHLDKAYEIGENLGVKFRYKNV